MRRPAHCGPAPDIPIQTRRIVWRSNWKIWSDDTKASAAGRQNCGGIFEAARLDEELADIEKRAGEPGFWNNQAEAQKVMQRRRRSRTSRR